MSLIIAEVGPNHNGDMGLAKKHIQAAKECGADIVKFQLYDTDRLVAKDYEFYGELKRGELNKEQWQEIVTECNRVDIEFLASAFHADRVAWCEEAGMKKYKIASRSIYEKELITTIEKTGKPIIASLGMYKGNLFPVFHTKAVVWYLYCVSKYPAALCDLHFAENYKRYQGYSDHTPGIEACIVALSRGARIIEKHFILEHRSDDPCASADPKELKDLVSFAHDCEVML